MSENGGKTGKASVGETPAHRRSGTCPRWMKLVLVLSLAANLAVAGVVIGHELRSDDKERGDWTKRAVAWIIELVPEDQRNLARARFEGVTDEIKAARARRHGYLPAVVAAMQADPFDAAALDEALDRMFDGPESGRQILRAHLIGLLDALPPADRAIFARKFREKMESIGDGGEG